jgi:hypothetical protein
MRPEAISPRPKTMSVIHFFPQQYNNIITIKRYTDVVVLRFVMISELYVKRYNIKYESKQLSVNYRRWTSINRWVIWLHVIIMVVTITHLYMLTTVVVTLYTIFTNVLSSYE